MPQPKTQALNNDRQYGEAASLPVIDLSPFRKGPREDRLAVARTIGQTLETIGFFTVTGHGIQPAIMTAAQQALGPYFAQPETEKRLCQRKPGRYRGYIPTLPFARENAVEGRPPILYEAFIVGHDIDPGDPAVRTTRGLLAPTPWPAKPQSFQAAIRAYWQAVDSLALDLLRAFALALSQPEDRLLAHFKQPMTNMSLLHYLPRPKLDRDQLDEGDDVPPHHDTNAVTIVLPGEVGGLEVLTAEGAWVKAKPPAGALVVNIGNMMETWSGGRFCSTLHRVHPPLGLDRYSIAHFATPDYDTEVTPLPGLERRDGVRPALHAGRDFAAFVASFDD